MSSACVSDGGAVLVVAVLVKYKVGDEITKCVVLKSNQNISCTKSQPKFRR